MFCFMSPPPGTTKNTHPVITDYPNIWEGNTEPGGAAILLMKASMICNGGWGRGGDPKFNMGPGLFCIYSL